MTLESLLEKYLEIVWVTLPNGANVYCNQRLVDYTGLSLEEFRGDGWSKPFHPEDRQRIIDAWAVAVKSLGIYSLECRLRRHDGAYRWWLVRGEPQRDASGNVLKWFGTCTDVHDLKLAEMEISRTNRALKMLSACNEALVRAEDEQDLLDKICRIAVEHGGYRMAWVGYARDDEARSIQPVAHAGIEEGFLAENDVSWSEGRPNGQGPAGRVIRDGKIIVCEDLERDPDFAPWRESALRRGYRGLIDLPLRTDASNFGLVGLWTSEVRVPAAEEMKLLQELSNDLAFGIESLRSRQEARRMQEAQLLAARRTELAARASKVGIWDWDVAQGTMLWDEPMHALYGADPDTDRASIELWKAYLHPDDRERASAELADALQPEGRPFDTRFRIILRGSGNVRHIRAQALVFWDQENRPLRMLGTNWDVTNQIEREEILQEKLRNEIQLRLQASAGEKAKSEFLAVMSHEIRTPMNGLLGFAEMLAHSPTLSPGDRELSQTILSSGEALLRILDDILDFSRIEAGRLAIEQKAFSPRDLVGDLQTLFMRQIQDKGLAFTVEIEENLPYRLEGDAGRIRQILANLIGNALKFTMHGSIQVCVCWSGPDPASRCLEFVIRDTGPGIAPDRTQAVFEAFTQEDSSTSRRHGGTGLGLTISRRLAELMGGTLRMTSELGQGTVFTLRIPLRLAQSSENASTEDAASFLRMDAEFALNHPLSILVVEDDRLNLKLMLKVLRCLGYEPVAATNGVEAVRAYTERNPDCVLMDLQMPEMDGMEAARKIRAFETERHLQPAFISALTANILPEDKQRCLSNGMNAYLNKPVKSQTIAGLLIDAWKFRHPAN